MSVRKGSAACKQILNAVKMWTDIAKLHAKKMPYVHDLSSLTQTACNSSPMPARVQAWESVFFPILSPCPTLCSSKDLA